MGWIMGFRNMSYTNPNKEENKEENWRIKAESVADLYGPKYVMFYTEDFNQNKIPDIQEIDDETVIDKTTSFLESIKSLHDSEKLAIVMNYILTNVDMSELSKTHKNILQKLI